MPNTSKTSFINDQRRRQGQHDINALHRKPKTQRSRVNNSEISNKQRYLFIALALAIATGKVIAEANQVSYEMAPGLTAKQQKNCQKAQRNFARLAKDFTHVQQALDKGGKQLTIRCVDRKYFDDEQDASVAFFHAGKKRLTHSDNAPKQILSHECLHARAFFSGKECKVSDSLATIPVIPFTQAQINKLHKAFDKGDARIKRYQAIILKQAEGLKLSKTETNLLKKYDEASKGVIISEERLYVSQKDHDFVINKLKKSKSAIVDYPDYGSIFEFSKAGYDKAANEFYIYGKPRRGRAIVMLTPNIVNTYLQHYRSRGTPEHKLLAEREAFSFQAFPEKAQQVFYAEAYAMRKEIIEKCEQKAKSSAPRVEL